MHSIRERGTDAHHKAYAYRRTLLAIVVPGVEGVHQQRHFLQVKAPTDCLSHPTVVRMPIQRPHDPYLATTSQLILTILFEWFSFSSFIGSTWVFQVVLEISVSKALSLFCKYQTLHSALLNLKCGPFYKR